MDDKPVASVDPRALGAFEAEMQRRNVDLVHFNLHFFEKGLDYLIVLESKTREPGLLGADPNHPELEVLVSGVSFQVKRVTHVK